MLSINETNLRKQTQSQKTKKNKNNKISSIKYENRRNNYLNKRLRRNNITRNISNIFQNKTRNKKEIENSNFKPDTDYENNWLLYLEAIKYYKRTSCDYYGSLLKSKQLFIFTFCSFNDYNSGIIKKFMLFLSFALHFTVNALFIRESTMHQIYEDEGKFNYEYQISKILYSGIISTFVLRIVLQTLVLTDKDVLEVKKRPTKGEAIIMKQKRLKCMKIKFIIFFLLNFILLGLFWYYLICFNAIYKNTHIYLIKNTFISFAFSLFYPFIINIFRKMLRMCSLRSSNKDQKYLYIVSQIIQVLKIKL